MVKRLFLLVVITSTFFALNANAKENAAQSQVIATSANVDLPKAEIQCRLVEVVIKKIKRDPKTGKIITMVSAPEIDLNILSSKIPQKLWNELLNSKAKPLANKSIAGLYPSGSTFKVVSGSAILESGISPYQSIYSTGAYTFGKVTFRDSHTSGHGVTNFYKSIEESVNTYYYQLSLALNLRVIVFLQH